MNLWVSILDAAIRLTVPLLLVALGELIAQRSGVIDIGIEGMMSAGAYVGFLLMAATGDAAIASVGAIVAGMSVSSVMAGVSIWGGVNQILTGFALFVMVPAITAFLYQQNMTGLQVTPPLPLLAVPVLSDIPVLGKILFDQNAFYYAAVVLSVGVWFLLNRTSFGLAVAACGQDPEVAASKGLRVKWIRTCATLCCGGFAGLAGAAITVGALGQFSAGVTGGRGFIAIATVILGRWRLPGVVVAAIAIGFTDAAQLRLAGLVHVSGQLMAMIPWFVVLLMLIAGARSAKMPRALGRNFSPSGTR